jgi:hypothetical protein
MPSNVDEVLATTIKSWFEECFGGTTDPPTETQIKDWKILRSILSAGSYFPPEDQGSIDDGVCDNERYEDDPGEEVGFGSLLVEESAELEFDLQGPVVLPTGLDACDSDEMGSDDGNPKVVDVFFPPSKRQKTITLTLSNQVSGLTSSSYNHSSSS